MYLLIPKISIILKGKPDRNNKKLLYMRYAIGGKTSWLSLKVSVDESSWDSKKRMVKGRSTDAPNINQYINSIKFEADQICFEWASKNRGKLLSFEMFKGFGEIVSTFVQSNADGTLKDQGFVSFKLPADA